MMVVAYGALLRRVVGWDTSTRMVLGTVHAMDEAQAKQLAYVQANQSPEWMVDEIQTNVIGGDQVVNAQLSEMDTSGLTFG